MWKDAALISVAVASSLGAGCTKTPPESASLQIAAAADLEVAFKEVGAAYAVKSGKNVSFTFGSTGLLAKQIEEGAPYDVFAGANVAFVDDAVKSGACLGETKALYARGRIALFVRKNAANVPHRLEDLAAPAIAKIAIANPEHAPYGHAAKEALERAGVWDRVKTKIVYGENVQETLTFAETGNADAAIVALSLAMTAGGTYTPIDASLHAPLDQALVVCKGGARGGRVDEARAFTDFVASPSGRAILRTHGFQLPGESAANDNP